MRHFLLLSLFFALAACVSTQGPYIDASKASPYEGVYTGQPEDAIITRYGEPSRRSTAKGKQILEYSVHSQLITHSKQRVQERCTLRFWLADKKVVNVDDIGDRLACVHFLNTRKRKDSINSDDWPPKEYP